MKLIFTLSSPLRVPQSKHKDWILNLNSYRNTHYQTLNTVKINYKKAMQEQIARLPALKVIQVEYTLYPKTRRLCDLNNVICIHSKFFLDALVELGKLPEDTYQEVTKETFQFGGVDPSDPRCSIRIEEIHSS